MTKMNVVFQYDFKICYLIVDLTAYYVSQEKTNKPTCPIHYQRSVKRRSHELLWIITKG
jgi:hypothetical protein